MERLQKLFPASTALFIFLKLPIAALVSLKDVLSEGQTVDVKIIDIDAEKKRISLSIRALLEENYEDEE